VKSNPEKKGEKLEPREGPRNGPYGKYRHRGGEGLRLLGGDSVSKKGRGSGGVIKKRFERGSLQMEEKSDWRKSHGILYTRKRKHGEDQGVSRKINSKKKSTGQVVE